MLIISSFNFVKCPSKSQYDRSILLWSTAWNLVPVSGRDTSTVYGGLLCLAYRQVWIESYAVYMIRWYRYQKFFFWSLLSFGLRSVVGWGFQLVSICLRQGCLSVGLVVWGSDAERASIWAGCSKWLADTCLRGPGGGRKCVCQRTDLNVPF